MIFYRLGLQRVIEYLQLDKIFKEDDFQEKVLELLHKKPKPVHKTKLKIDETMNLYVSILLSAINVLSFLTIPHAVLESPCEGLEMDEAYMVFVIAKWLEDYVVMMDRFLIALIMFLIFLWGKTIQDGMNRTNLKISPWVERGKYFTMEKI